MTSFVKTYTSYNNLRDFHIVVTGSDDNTAKVWRFKEGSARLIATLTDGSLGPDQAAEHWSGHTAGITSVAVSNSQAQRDNHDAGRIKKGKRNSEQNTVVKTVVLTTSRDNLAKVWTSNGEKGDPFVCKTTLPPAQAASDPQEKELKEKMPFLRKLQKKYTSLAPDARHAVATTERQPGHFGAVHMGSFRPPGSRRAGVQLVTCSADSTAILWDVSIGPVGSAIQRHTLWKHELGHFKSVTHTDWSNTEFSKKVVTSSNDGQAIIWDIKSGRPQVFMPKSEDRGRGGPIWSSYFSPDDSKILSTSKDGFAKVFDAPDGRCIYQAGGGTSVAVGQDVDVPESEKTVSAQWYPHGDLRDGLFCTCHFNGDVLLHDIRSTPGHPAVRMYKHAACAWSAQFRPMSNVTHLLTASHDMTAAVSDMTMPGRPLSLLLGHYGILWQATYSPTAAFVVTCSEDSTSRIWDMSMESARPPSLVLAEPGERTTHGLAVTCAAFDPDYDLDAIEADVQRHGVHAHLPSRPSIRG
mmetsp:Transcript_36944/g.81090  ORF Transcript_36944/g.81090 Transcript_36944/m.81090 type:complete len:523 (+) Transcript_36944:64-1632(+)